MRRVWLPKEDFGLFHQDITPLDYEFFRTHLGAFKRMWSEQTRRFWALFVNAFEHFIWNYGIMKDFPMKVDEIREYIDEIIFYIRDQFVDGRVSTAKNLVEDCVTVTQNKHCIAALDKTSYAQNPFYMAETRAIFRRLFGPPDHRRTFMKVLCGFSVYIKFAGAAVTCLRRWLSADSIPSEDRLESEFLENVHCQSPTASQLALEYNPELLRTINSLSVISSSDKLKKRNSSSQLKTERAANSAKDLASSATDSQETANALSKKKQRKRKKKTAQRDEASPHLDSDPKDEGGGGGEKEIKPVLREGAKSTEREKWKKSSGETVSVEKSSTSSKGDDTSSIEKTVNGDIADGEDTSGKDASSPVKSYPVSQEAEVESREKDEQKTAAEIFQKEAIVNGTEKELVTSNIDCRERETSNTCSSPEVVREEDKETKMATISEKTGKEVTVLEEVDLNMKGKEGETLVVSSATMTNGRVSDVEEERKKETEKEREKVAGKVSSDHGTKKAISKKTSDGVGATTVGEDTSNSGTSREKERGGVATNGRNDDSKMEERGGGTKEGKGGIRDRDMRKKLHSCDHEPREREKDSSKKKLHSCAWCKTAETQPKSFKRCQRCRGRPNPKYYCSRECQAKHWKEHKFDHKESNGGSESEVAAVP